MTWNTLSKAFKAQMIIRKVNQLSLYFDGILVLPELLPLAWHGEKATYLPAADFATCFVRFKVTWITTITSASAAALQTRVKPHLWGLGRVGNLVGPRVTKLLFVGFADVRNPRRRRARQRRTSSPFAVCGFFSPYSLRGGGTILWELGSVHNFTASITATRARVWKLPDLDLFHLESRQIP